MYEPAFYCTCKGLSSLCVYQNCHIDAGFETVCCLPINLDLFSTGMWPKFMIPFPCFDVSSLVDT